MSVNLTVQGRLATITLARPESGNALDWAAIDAFAGACERIGADGSVRAVLIEAEGRNFCVGGDLNTFVQQPDPADFIGRLARRLHDGVRILAGLRAPVIAAVQGAAAGAGLSLIAGADLVVAGRSSSYRMAYTAIGLVADGGATWLLPRVIGLRRAQDLAYTNRRLTAEEALDWGLVTRLVDDAAVATDARALAAAIADGPTFAFGEVKRLLGESSLAGLPAHLEAEVTAIGAAMATRDARDAIAAFVERRPPEFTGR